MDSLSEVLSAELPLSLPVLHDLGRQSLRSYFSSIPHTNNDAPRKLYEALVQTAYSHSVADKHLTAACNALCVFIRCACSCEVPEVRRFAYSESVWTGTLSVIHRSFREGKNKPALQVLDILIHLTLENINTKLAASLLKRTISDLVSILVRGQPQAQLKETCIVLSHFLRKLLSIVPFSGYLDCMNETLRKSFHVRCAEISINLHRLDAGPDEASSMIFLALLLTIQMSEPRSVALKLFSYLCSKGEKHDFTYNIGAASQAIQIYLEANGEALTEFATTVFPAVLSHKDQFNAFAERHNPSNGDSGHNIQIFLAIVQVGCEKGFWSPEDLLQIIARIAVPNSISTSKKLNDYAVFGVLLSSLEPQIRLRAMKLLTLLPAAQSLISADALQCLTKNAIYLHNDSDAYYREEYVGILRHFLQRVIRSADTANKAHVPMVRPNNNESVTNQHWVFFEQYIEILIYELSPSASYPRHILALQVLRLIIDVTSARALRSLSEIRQKSLIQILISLVLDPFEDVREVSTLILQVIGHLQPNLSFHAVVPGLLQSMQAYAASTKRADHADALGKLLLLDEIASQFRSPEHPSSLSNQNLSKPSLRLLSASYNYLQTLTALSPASSFPLHGNLLGIAYQIHICAHVENDVALKVFDICSQVWRLVYDDLCVDSPERTTIGEGEDDYTGPKDHLAYSWRALRDSSLVIQATVLKLTNLLDMDIVRKMGSLSLAQLTHLRHRGAFSTVAQTFSTCCRRVWEAKSDLLACNDLMDEWRKEAFGELERQASKLTRRSAGLPAIFTGLLNPSEQKHFLSIVENLVTIASAASRTGSESKSHNEQRLPQVHALNCLKEIMTNSKFRTASEPLVTKMLSIAAQSMGSNIWAIRNCGLMLFRSCISRLSADVREYDNDRHDLTSIDVSPLTLAVNLLHKTPDIEMGKSVDVIKLSEHVFAALDLLGRLISPGHSQTIINTSFEGEIGNMIWAVREHAAHLRTSIIGSDEEVITINTLLSSSDSHLSPNEVHGRLICTRHILHSLLNRAGCHTGATTVLGIVEQITSFFEQALPSRHHHPLVLAVYFDILNDVYCACFDNEATREATDWLSITMITSHNVTTKSTVPTLHRALVLNKLFRNLGGNLQPIFDADDRLHGDYLNGELSTQLLQDADAVLFAVEHIASAAVPASKTIDLYLELVNDEYADDVRARAMLAISDIISSPFCVLSVSDLQQLERSIKLDTLRSRELLDAEILLSSGIAEYKFQYGDNKQDFDSLERLLNALQLCLLDEVETPSRLSAAMAIGSLSSLIPSNDSSTTLCANNELLRICLLMWDLLNDDDEDIREIVAGTTNSLLKRTGINNSLVTSCVLAVRNDLLSLMRIRFGHLSEFTAYAFMKIIGAKASISMTNTNNILAYVATSPAQLQIERIIESANDLFAEEKQNLYVDEISEINAWLKYAGISQISQFNDQIEARLSDWVMNGLLSLISLFGTAKIDEIGIVNGENLGPQGSSFDEQILVLSIRIANLAGLFLQRWKTQIEAEKDLGVMYANLIKLRDLCQRASVHPLLISVVEEVCAIEPELEVLSVGQ